MTREEMKKQAKKDYFALCVAQKKALNDTENKEKFEIGFHYSEGLIDGYKECLRSIGLLTDEEITDLEREGIIVSLLS